MITDAKLAANRANAQKSTGPKTKEGKERSSLNAIRHGLTRQTLIMNKEDLEAFNTFMEEIVVSFSVGNILEEQLAQSYANYQWRINRAAAVEENMFTLGNMEEVAENFNIAHPQAHNAATAAKNFRDRSQEFARIALYSQRLLNQAEKVLKQLKQMQAERKEREASEIDEAVAIYEVHRRQNLTFDPQKHGFVLTLDQIEGYLRRKRLTDPDFVAKMASRAA